MAVPTLYAGPTPDGGYISRKTYNEYTHAVTIVDTSEKKYYAYRQRGQQHPDIDEFGYIPNPNLGKWVSASWHTRQDLAMKAADKFRNNGFFQVEVVPVIDGKPPVATTESPKEDNMSAVATPTRKTNKVTAKSQGFPAAYLGDTGNFKPGLDARAKSDLRAAVAGKRTGKELHRFTKAAAEKLLAVRGW